VISLEVNPPIIFDLRKEKFPPPFYPYLYTTVYKNHLIKVKYRKEKGENVKYIEIYIKAKGNFPEGIDINNFLFSIEKEYIEGEEPMGFKTLSESYKFLMRIPAYETEKEIVIPFSILLKVNKSIPFHTLFPLNLNLSFRINVR